MDPKKLKKPGEAFSLADIDVPQGKFREQVDVVADELRQLAGNPEFKVDPLSAPYVLFVNGSVDMNEVTWLGIRRIEPWL